MTEVQRLPNLKYSSNDSFDTKKIWLFLWLPMDTLGQVSFPDVPNFIVILPAFSAKKFVHKYIPCPKFEKVRNANPCFPDFQSLHESMVLAF